MKKLSLSLLILFIFFITCKKQVIKPIEQKANEFIYMVGYSNNDISAEIYRINLNSLQLEQLTEGDRKYYIRYISDNNKIIYNKRDIFELWTMDPDGENEQLLFNHSKQMYRPIYSSAIEKFYFYTIEGYRRIASVNYNGSDFTYLTDYSPYNNYIPVLNSTGEPTCLLL